MTRTTGRRSAAPPGFWIAAILVFGLSMFWTVASIRTMHGTMDMPGGWTMSMMWMRMPGQSWPAAAGMFLAMWLAMMVAMMLPSALPMFLAHRTALVKRRVTRPDRTVVAAAASYFTVWLLVGAALWPVGVGWNFAAMHVAALSRAMPVLAGLALIGAGALQFTRRKRAGLACCRSSPGYVPLIARGGVRWGLVYGKRQGVACATCCAGPMIAMVVLGAMDPYVMTGTGVWIAVEKLLPRPEPAIRLIGSGAMVTGVVMTLISLAR